MEGNNEYDILFTLPMFFLVGSCPLVENSQNLVNERTSNREN